MLTNIDGKFMSTIYTVSNGSTTVVVSSTRDLQKELRISKEDADAILYGDICFQGYRVINVTEVEYGD